MVVVLGGDVHKKSHTFEAVDGNGRRLDGITVPATPAGHEKAVRWARRGFGDQERLWGIEDCRQPSGRLERDLLAAGESVVRVPPKLTARERSSARTRGKSDPIDALAVAVRDQLAEWLRTQDGLVAELALEILADIDRLSPRIEALAARLGTAVREYAPALLAVPGCGPLSAAKIVGETAGIARFRSEACFAMFAGTAPIPAWSGTAGRVRLNRSGNRQLNAALHRIAVTQTRHEGPGHDYYQHRLGSGDSTKEALRCLKRQITRAVYRALSSNAPTFEHAAA